MLGWHAEAHPKDKKARKQKNKETRHASRACKRKAVADVDNDTSDDQSQAEAVGHLLLGSMPAAEPAAEPAAVPAAVPAAEASLPVADICYAAAQDAEAHALPISKRASWLKRMRLDSDNPGVACEPELAGHSHLSAVQVSSSKKKKPKKEEKKEEKKKKGKSSKVWPFSTSMFQCGSMALQCYSMVHLHQSR